MHIFHSVLEELTTKRHVLKLTDLLFKVASNLIQTLDEHAFLLLSVLDQPEVIQESTNEIGNDLIRFKVHSY